MNSLVSVIIPAYNAEKTIVDCLESVREQTYKNLEVLVVNDGSTDDTLAVVKQYASAHKELDLKIYTIDNAGPASARNYAISHSKGEYVAFLDSDDKWLSTKIEKQMVCFRDNPKIDMLGCGYSRGIEKYVKHGGVKIVSKNLLLFKNFFITPTVIMKRSLFDNNKFEQGRKYSEDYYLWLQIVYTNHCCALLRESLVVLYDKPTYGASGLSSKLWLMEKGELRNYRVLYYRRLIPLWKYLIACSFSLLKYVRRLIVTVVRKK